MLRAKTEIAVRAGVRRVTVIDRDVVEPSNLSRQFLFDAADAAPPPDGRAERIASHGVAREVLSFYRIGNVLTGSQMGVKLETMKTRLFGGPQRAV